MIRSTTVSSILIIAAVLASTQAFSQQAAPLPAPIVKAKKVFIANAGVDALIAALDQGKSTVDRYYVQFYAAMRDWGHYQLVDSPSDADLVLEIYASSPVTSVSNGAARLQPQLSVSILDAKTHFLLWRVTESLEAGHPKMFGGVEGSDKLDGAAAGLIRRLKLLAQPYAESGDGKAAK